ncbi:hypothetical protein NDU88_006899 [Pleurodeles waltl]|uniref:Uncharacterized protein n=1 Tax=Pleurodeles waltl TaxID=8319 RepID=A0AAV7NS41_PLEWA|nr:hypothetical protein NDU88_006899 [Pleurodeles waltl]
MLSFKSQDKGSVDYESGMRRVNDLQDGRTFYEPGVLDDDVYVAKHAQHETSGTLGRQDIVREEIQDTVQDESLNRCLPKRAIVKPKYLDDYVLKKLSLKNGDVLYSKGFSLMLKVYTHSPAHCYFAHECFGFGCGFQIGYSVLWSRFGDTLEVEH